MKILRAWKTELDLTPAQRGECLRYAGTSRFAYNWGLRRCMAARQEWEALPEPRPPFKRETAYDLAKAWVAARPTDFPWASEVSSSVPETSLVDLDRAFLNFFRRLKKGEKPGFPRFKSRRNGIGSFRLRSQTIRVVDQRSVKIPSLGVLRLKENGYFPTDGLKILSATISERAGRWYISIQAETEIPDPVHPAPHSVVGVDVGIKSLAVTSDGVIYENPKALCSAMRKLKRAQRTLSRRVKGSANRRKAQSRVATIHARIGRIRQHAQHQVSHDLTTAHGVVVMEDLHIAGMVRNHSLAGALHDAGLSELRRQVSYKATWTGGNLLLADRWFPSSKTCSNCGTVRDTLTLGERRFVCPACGFQVDRDLNAAINLKNLAGKQPERKNACGGGKVQNASSVTPGEAGTLPMRPR